MSKQYVQHVSGQGEKWEVYGNYDNTWQIKAEPHWIYLPKSEYRLCEPPERWVDISEDCRVGHDQQIIEYQGCIIFQNAPGRLDEFRLRRTPHPYGCKSHWAFVVEKKVCE